MAGTATLPDGTAVSIGGALFQADFFDQLEEKKNADSIMFVKNGKMVEFFPSEMQLRLSVFPAPSFDFKTHRITQENLSAESLSGLRFLGFWKNGLEMRPVESLFLLTMSAVEQKSILFPLWPQLPETYQYQVWVFEFRVQTQGVPITDHFILTIETSTKQRLARLSARLGSRNKIR